MELNDAQRDALTELINIAYGRAASALSELTGHRISLQVPQVSIHRIGEMAPLLNGMVYGEVATVNQVFSGPISGNALLMLDEQAALMLTSLLTEQTPASGAGLDAGAREIITEVGNILLNACLGVFGNLLQVQVSFAVPRLMVETVSRMMRSITIGTHDLQHALVVHTRFQLLAGSVSGYLVIVLGITSLERLMAQIDEWQARGSFNETP